MKILGIHVLTDKTLQSMVDTADEVAYRVGITRAHSLIDEARQEGYNQGKQDGIALAKSSFTKALKQKGELNNDILR